MGDKVNNDVCGAVALGGTLVRIIDDENRTTTEAIGDETDADPMVGTILRDIWPNIVALLLVGGWRCWGGYASCCFGRRSDTKFASLVLLIF